MPWIDGWFLAAVIMLQITSRTCQTRWHEKAFHGLAPLILVVSSVYTNAYVAASLTGVWLTVLGRNCTNGHAWILKHFGAAIFVFSVFDIGVLNSGIVESIAADGTHAYTALIRDGLGRGCILGPMPIDCRLLSFSLIVVLPFLSSCLRQVYFFPIQGFFVLVSVFCRSYYSSYIASWGIVLTSSLCLVVIASYRVFIWPGSSVKWDGFVSRLAKGCVLIVFVSILGIHVSREAIRLHRDECNAISSGGGEPRPSVLFVNDCSDEEGSEHDMTRFDPIPTACTFDQFRKASVRPEYDVLAKRFLPAAGYDVTILSPSQISPEAFGQYQIIVMICLQHKLSAVQKEGLYNAIGSGKTSLLILGDHTDISGVQQPFNDLMGPLGVKLRYDSVYPFGEWGRQIVFAKHPINGSLWLPGSWRNICYSVGGSLEYDKWAAWPVLVGGDGFSDRGTPDAPMFAGLGDQQYTENEIRGGLALAVERPYGHGTVLAFGDTAFLQNGSISQNFSFVASVFKYLQRPHWRVDTVYSRWSELFAACTAIAVLTVTYSSRFAVVCVLLLLANGVYGGTLDSDRRVASGLNANLLIIDDCHGQNISQYDSKNGISMFVDVLNLYSDHLVLTTNAFDIDRMANVHGVVLMAPRGCLSIAEQAKLLEVVAKGGSLVCTSGYYESLMHREWLNELGCEITGKTLGAGQQVSAVDRRANAIPSIAEAWAMDLSSAWWPTITCYGLPVVALREYKRGRVCIVSDGHMFLNETMGSDKEIRQANYLFSRNVLDYCLSRSVGVRGVSTSQLGCEAADGCGKTDECPKGGNNN
jgi:hypothetical protein